MADARKDGGPAFPHLNPNFDGNWDKNQQRGGMSLRDWFAGLTAHGPHPDLKIWSEDALRRVYAEGSYALADAMLAERAKVGGAS